MKFPERREDFKKNLTLKEFNEMLIKLKIEFTARQRPDGRYEIRPNINGKRVSIYGFTPDEISKKYKSLIRGAKSNDVESKSKASLFVWLDEWCEIYKKPNVAKNTYLALTRCIASHIKTNFRDKPLNKYTSTELTQGLNKIESTRMRKYTRGILRDAFQRAVYAGLLKESPAQNLLPVKHISKKGKAIPLSELREMLQNAGEKLDKDAMRYFLFCLFAGTRRDEALNLTGGDCDFKNKIIYIRGTKTEGSNRRLPMFPILEKILRTANAGKGEKVFKIGKHRADDDFKIFRGAESCAVLHWLRHTFGTVKICVESIPANTVALWMGHSDAATTTNIYTHPEDLAPDIYYSGQHSETEKMAILNERYNKIISLAENLL